MVGLSVPLIKRNMRSFSPSSSFTAIFMGCKMRGKKTDPEFVSKFITDCVREGIETPEAIVIKAKSMIAEIDEAIKEIEEDKKFRSKLLNVVASFDYSKRDKSGDAKLLPFFELKYPKECRILCELLQFETDKLPAMNMATFGHHTMERNFSIKQLTEAKVIDRVSDQLVRGERFDEYLAFIGLE